MTDKKQKQKPRKLPRHITLPEYLAERAKRIGGSVSAGIRKALEAYNG